MTAAFLNVLEFLYENIEPYDFIDCCVFAATTGHIGEEARTLTTKRELNIHSHVPETDSDNFLKFPLLISFIVLLYFALKRFINLKGSSLVRGPREIQVKGPKKKKPPQSGSLHINNQQRYIYCGIDDNCQRNPLSSSAKDNLKLSDDEVFREMKYEIPSSTYNFPSLYDKIQLWYDQNVTAQSNNIDLYPVSDELSVKVVVELNSIQDAVKSGILP